MSEARVRDSLTSFLKVPAEDVDDIILNYVVSVVGELVSDQEESFDADGFMEMLSAYVPQAQVGMEETVEWMAGLAEQERNSQSGQKDSRPEFDLKSVIDTTVVASSKQSSVGNSKRSPRVSEGEGDEHKSEEKGFKNRVTRLSEGSGDGQDGDDESVKVLLEMFPYSCSVEVTHCLRLSAGDVAEAAQLVMHRHEAGQSLKPSKAKVRPAAHRVTDDKAVKSRILDQYSYVDQDDDQKYHRPTLRSADDKKLIRYRDGKIVSTKGERFTQVSKQESEEMKKSIVTNGHSNSNPNQYPTLTFY